MTEKVGLAANQRAAVAALVSSPSVEEAARRAGCSSRTIRRWRENPEFQDALRGARRDVLEGAAGLLAETLTESITALKSVVNDVGAHPAARVAAAKAVLDGALKMHECLVLEERMTSIERACGVRQ